MGREGAWYHRIPGPLRWACCLLVLQIGCLGHVSAPRESGTPLALPYTVTVQVHGTGKLPPVEVAPLSRPVRVDLCVKTPEGKLTVLDADGQTAESVALAVALRAFDFSLRSPVPLGNGLLCFAVQAARDDAGRRRFSVVFKSPPSLLTTTPPSLRPLRPDELPAWSARPTRKDGTFTVLEETAEGPVRVLILAPSLVVDEEAAASADAAPLINRPKIVHLRPQLLEQPDPHLPDRMKSVLRGRTVSGAYRICLDASGVVRSVDPLVPLLGADAHVMAPLRQWRFRPQPVPLCVAWKLQFIVE